MRLREHGGIIPGRIDILYCRPQAITTEDGYNVRDLTTAEARAELDELKAQVKEHGVLTPLKIRFNGEQIILVEGHRRRTVALELIAEWEASGGTEGRNIEAVPIFPEAPGTTVEDRDAGLLISNTGSKLKPLELANLIYRMHTVRGLPLENVAQRLGISMPVLKNHLDMRAMPEPVEEQVRSGAVSATHAAKLVKEQPDLAEQIIKDAADEQRRHGKRGRATPQATAKAPGRTTPKPEPKSDPKLEPSAQNVGTRGHSPLTEDRPPIVRQLSDEERAARAALSAPEKAGTSPQATVPDELHERTITVLASVDGDAPHDRVVTLPERPPLMTEVSRPNYQQLIAQKIQRYLGKIALLAEENSLHEREPAEDLKGFTVELCAEGAAIYREIIGDDVAGAA